MFQVYIMECIIKFVDDFLSGELFDCFEVVLKFKVGMYKKLDY